MRRREEHAQIEINGAGTRGLRERPHLGQCLGAGHLRRVFKKIGGHRVVLS